jgi:hypothetical protein
MPGTEGGSSTKVNASESGASCCCTSARMRAALSPSGTRCANGFNETKITPVFGALVNVAPSKPVKATEFCTPGRSRMIFDACRITASVRPSEAPGGSWNAAIR